MKMIAVMSLFQSHAFSALLVMAHPSRSVSEGTGWPNNYAGFDYSGYALQSTTSLRSPTWTTNSPAPVIVNQQNTVTNPISGTQQFYRLRQ